MITLIILVLVLRSLFRPRGWFFGGYRGRRRPPMGGFGGPCGPIGGPGFGGPHGPMGGPGGHRR